MEHFEDKQRVEAGDILCGEKVYLRRPTPEEMSIVRRIWADPETMREVGGPVTLTDAQAEDWYRHVVANAGKRHFYCLIFNNENEPVGEVSYHRYDESMGTAEFNIKVIKQYRGQGYSRESMYLILRHYFLVHGGKVMLDPIARSNIHGQLVLLNFGFEHDPAVEEDFMVQITKERFLELYP